MQYHITKRSMNKVKDFSFKYIGFFLSNILISATGSLLQLPGNNSVQSEDETAIAYSDNVIPPLIAPVYAYTGPHLPPRVRSLLGKPTLLLWYLLYLQTSSTPTPPKLSSSGNGHNVAAVTSTPSVATVATPSNFPTVFVPPLSHSST